MKIEQRTFRIILEHADHSREMVNGITREPVRPVIRITKWCRAGGCKGGKAGTYRLTYRVCGIIDEDCVLYRYSGRRKVKDRLPRSRKDGIEQWRNKVAEEDARAGIHPEDARSPQASRVLYWKRVLGAAHARAVRAGVAKARGGGRSRVQGAGKGLEGRLSLALEDDVDQEPEEEEA